MGYSDQKFYSREENRVLNAIAFGSATGAGTASNSLAAPAATYLPSFYRRTVINKLSTICLTAPNAAATAVTLTILNGTNTAGSVVVTTATAGQVIQGVVTANNTFTALGEPTMALIGTWTASGGTSGTWDLYFETQELPT